jgi:PEP-CTERM motif
MQARVPIRLAAISVVLSVFLIGLARDASAAPLVLDNDVDVSWADSPCGPSFTHIPTLCLDPLLVFGAPRFVVDARNVGDLLKVEVDFLSVAIEPNPPGNNTLFLNVGDVALNQVLRPGTDIPLRLSYSFPVSGFDANGRIPASDVVLTLPDFEGFDVLPQGDLFFTVSFVPRLSFSGIDGSPGRPAYAAIITLSGPGTVVPEPGTLILLLAGLATTWLGARWRHADRHGP